jgi:hypothetical protein
MFSNKDKANFERTNMNDCKKAKENIKNKKNIFEPNSLNIYSSKK